MRIRFLSVGKPRDSAAGELFDRYAKRIKQLGVDCEANFVPEVKLGGRFSESHVRVREAEQLRSRIPKGKRTIALDVRGRAYDSLAWGERIERWLTPESWWLIGGPTGLDDDLLASCDERLSLSTLTLPHELARVMVAEQVYRALTLAKGFPYHKA